MSISNSIYFQEDGCTNLYQWIRDVVPNFVCDIPVVTYLDGLDRLCQVDDRIVVANLIGIKKAWGLARGIGESTLSYSCADNQLVIREGILYSRPSIRGQVNAGLIQTHLNNNEPFAIYDPSSIHVAHFYGIPSYVLDRGHSILSPQLIGLILSYIKQIHTIIHRVENSYGSMTSLEGLDMGDEPLLQAVQDKINSDWDKSKRIMAPGGSRLGEVDISLTDTDKMLIPLEDAIATEAQIPRRLLFPNKPSSAFELEDLAIWATREFKLKVAPALDCILRAQGYNVREIQPPSYRDSKHQAEVRNIISDTEYKNSAAGKNQAATKAIERGEEAPGINMGRQL